MLSKRERLPRVRIASASGKSIPFLYGSIRRVPAPTSQGAVVVSKKTFKTSVLRHAVRRRLLVAVRKLIQGGAILGGIIVYANRSASSAKPQEFEKALRLALGIQNG